MRTTSPPTQHTLPPMGYGDYLRFSRLVNELFGLNFPEKRRGDLEHGIRQAFAASTCANLNDYYQLLFDPDKGSIHQQQLVNALTIGESHFFRNTGHFDALFKHILPEIIERRRALRTIRIWSAGCSSGEEPYSIAMMLRELLPDVDQWAITILATDINTEALDRARRAQYSEWAFREPRAKQWRPRYFTPQKKRYALMPQVRKMVTFAQLNLAEDAYPSFQTNTTFMDLVLCRNVTIYFAPTTTRDIISRFYDALVDGGWLVVGHSEHSITTYRQFQARSYPNAILYQRTGQPTLVPQDWDWLSPTPESKQAPAGVPSLRVPEVTIANGKNASPLLATLTTPTSNEVKKRKKPKVDRRNQAEELMEYGHSEQARDILIGVVSDNGHDATACALLGKAYANLGEWIDAERWCRKAIEMDTLQLTAYYNLALVLQHQGELEQAIDMMKKVVYLDQAYILGHYGLADLYHSYGQLPLALKALDNTHNLLISSNPTDLIPGSGGITIGNLLEAITCQQQQWRAEAMGREW